jgi:histidinol dehydrogenase
MPLADAMHAHEAAPSRTNVNGLQADVLQFTNEYAPEHLVIATDDCESYCDGVVNAGSVFLGHWTPESVGDYASGTNHSLPTYGYARMYGGVSLDTFVKYITLQRLSPLGLQNVGPCVEIMAEGPGPPGAVKRP